VKKFGSKSQAVMVKHIVVMNPNNMMILQNVNLGLILNIYFKKLGINFNGLNQKIMKYNFINPNKKKN
jgi:hypothetical protein